MVPEESQYEDQSLWAAFKVKLKMTNSLFCYDEFFERILHKVCREYVRELVTVMEFKHELGTLYNQNGDKLSIKQELAIFHRVERAIKQVYGLVEIRIIVTGVKHHGTVYMKNQLDALIEADNMTDMIAGFDMSNEEDQSPPIDDYLELLYSMKLKYGDKF